MSKIKSLHEALNRLDQLMKQAEIEDPELKDYITELHTDKQNALQKLNKLRQTSTRDNTTSSMHSKLKDALYE